MKFRRIGWMLLALAGFAVGGVVAVFKAKPPHYEQPAQAAPAEASMDLPPGHPDIHGKSPHTARPLTDQEMALGECPFMAGQKKN